MWASFLFPTISYESICLKVDHLMQSASKSNKIPSNKKTGKSFLKSLGTYEEMFDICSCSCYENGIARLECRCDKRILVLKWDVFVDKKLQKSQLGRIDVQTTLAQKETAQRKIDDIKLNEKRCKNLHHYKLLNVALKLQALIVVEVYALNLRCQKN